MKNVRACQFYQFFTLVEVLIPHRTHNLVLKLTSVVVYSRQYIEHTLRNSFFFEGTNTAFHIEIKLINFRPDFYLTRFLIFFLFFDAEWYFSILKQVIWRFFYLSFLLHFWVWLLIAIVLFFRSFTQQPKLVRGSYYAITRNLLFIEYVQIRLGSLLFLLHFDFLIHLVSLFQFSCLALIQFLQSFDTDTKMQVLQTDGYLLVTIFTFHRFSTIIRMIQLIQLQFFATERTIYCFKPLLLCFQGYFVLYSALLGFSHSAQMRFGLLKSVELCYLLLIVMYLLKKNLLWLLNRNLLLFRDDCWFFLQLLFWFLF